MIIKNTVIRRPRGTRRIIEAGQGVYIDLKTLDIQARYRGRKGFKKIGVILQHKNDVIKSEVDL